MGFFERYLRNRSLWQIGTNYLGVVGATFFALQNLSTNWGGNYQDDYALTAAVKSNVLAGTAWDERYMQVGALQLTWALLTLFTELQGNMTAGRYKRMITWVLNFPTCVFMVGNIILSVLREDTGVQDGVAWDVVFSTISLLLVIVNTANFATHETYKHHRWLVVVAGKCSDDEPERRQLPPSCMANRYVPMGLLNIVVVACLLYFAIVGLAGFENNMGHLLTTTYESDAMAVKAWDSAGGTVGMLALGLSLMFIGVELQGDLTPANYKGLCVFAGCINIFVSSIFMYATHWDAFDKDVITTHIPPLIIMIVLCIWAILVIVLFGCVDKYVESSWIKPLADEEVQTIKYDPETGTGFVIGDAAPGALDPAPPAKLADPAPVNVISLVSDAERETKPEPLPEPEVQPAVEPEVQMAVAPVIEEVKVDPDFKLQPVVEEEDLADIIVSWRPPPGTTAAEIEYKMEVTDMDSENHEKEVFILPGSRTKYMVDELGGEPIIPDEQFLVECAWRYKRDADREDGGWQGHSKPTTVSTLPMTKPAVLLRSRVPRIHLRETIGFKSNHDDMTRGMEALPEVAALMHEHPDMTLGVDGHVNFGQKPADAQRLSRMRAERVCDALMRLGVDRERLVAAGHGYERPRYPRGTKFASRNRRVEFRVLPGSPLFERLEREAGQRLREVNGVAEVESFMAPSVRGLHGKE